METIKIEKYKAEDGKVFDSVEECKKHEEHIEIIKDLTESILKIKTICESSDCTTCVFNIDNSDSDRFCFCVFREYYPRRWDAIIEKFNKQNKEN